MSKFSKIRQIISKERVQVIVYGIISVVLLTFTGILYVFNPLSFVRFFGSINPLLLVPVILGLGLLFLIFFVSKSWFNIYNKNNLKKMLKYQPIALLLASIAILIDIWFKYPEDTNILFPESLLFYPIMGFVAETIFHIIPLALILLVLNGILKNFNLQRYMWICIIIISLIEPIFQALSIPSHFPLGVSIYMSFHLFLFNAIQLYFFKQYDFFSMYSFRLVYYLLWHIIWGYFRLGVLF